MSFKDAGHRREREGGLDEGQKFLGKVQRCKKSRGWAGNGDELEAESRRELEAGYKLVCCKVWSRENDRCF